MILKISHEIRVPGGKCLEFPVSEFKTDVASRSCSRDYLLADFPLADLRDEGSAASLEVLDTRPIWWGIRHWQGRLAGYIW
jgi:hypothetical protein